MKNLLLSATILFLLYSCSSDAGDISFRKIAEEINGQYGRSFYRSVAFSQYAIQYSNSSVADTQVWHEAYLYPGNLIIKFDSISSGSGMLFRNDSMYEIRNDTILSVQYMPHDLIVLTMDMFQMRPDDIMKRVSELGYDTAAVCRGMYKDRPVYIVGTTDSTDRKTKQFWLDEYNFFCYRVIMTRDYGTREVILEDILTKSGKWIEQEVVFKKNGVTDLREEYFNITFNYPVDSAVFNPIDFSERKW